MKTTYWYKDNWTGACKSFKTLKEAKANAVNEDGSYITICKNDGSRACEVKANGYTYP